MDLCVVNIQVSTNIQICDVDNWHMTTLKFEFVLSQFDELTGHDESNSSPAIGEEHSPVGGLAGQHLGYCWYYLMANMIVYCCCYDDINGCHPLVVALPGNSSKNQEEPVVNPQTHVLRLNLMIEMLSERRTKM